MTPAPRRAPARSGGKSASAIPQVSWRAPQPAPIVLVSGPEEVCAERAIAGVRDYLRAEDASLEVSDLRADDWLLYAMDSPWAGNSRGFSRGSVYNRAGQLVASVTQEGLIRHRKDWA